MGKNPCPHPLYSTLPFLEEAVFINFLYALPAFLDTNPSIFPPLPPNTVNQNSQRGVVKERLHSGETVCKPRKCSLWWKSKVCSTETKGRPAFYTESFHGSKSCILIGHCRAVLMGLYRCK